VSTAVALVLFGCIVAYAIFGGADFGAGFWDLLAGGSERGARPRALIDAAIGPVWEADHVWLIFCFVVLWSGFSQVYASIWLTLFVPLTLAALGIVLRGAGFAFRKAVVRASGRRELGAIFATSSVLVPFFLGTVAGAIASGEVPAGGKAGDPVQSWINPTSFLGGVLAVAVVAFLAAVYLVADAARLEDPHMVEYFRRRAIGSGLATGVVALAGVFVLRSDASYVFHGLTARALPLVILAAVCGAVALVLLVRANHRGARLLSIGAVASIILAWGVAQWDYMLPTTTTVAQAASPSGTLTTLIVVTVAALVVVVPAFVLLFVLDQRGLLPEEGVTGTAEVLAEVEQVP
jgi:cytochrome d ubiquinol oxidase subunit II